MYLDMSQHRQASFGDEPLLISEMYAYFNMMGIDSVEDRAFYFKLVTSMDQAYLKWRIENKPKSSK